MPAMRKRATSPEPTHESGGTLNMSLYEQCRQQRIQENLQRMQSLGILALSLQLKSHSQARSSTRRPFGRNSIPLHTDTPPLPSSGPVPVRRSSRLQNVTPVSYSEAVAAKMGKALHEESIQLDGGSRPEIYTEEHEKLLGDTERTWTLFVDGYDKDGRRIYDPIRGKTCHQCRQKTLGHRTHCNQCNMVQGQFCGDCLYMRYGEHVLEALENPNWICPVCRGICNCSLCRTGKGWLPTGTIYRKITKLGYKSVAHYLIQTKRSQPTFNKELEATNQASAKRSLSFQDLEALSQEDSETADDLLEKPKLQNRDNRNDDDDVNYVDGNADDGSIRYENDNKTDKNLNSAKRSLSFLPSSGDEQASVINFQVQGDYKLSDSISKDERAMKQNSSNEENKHESCQERRKRKVFVEPNTDSIGGRLRQRRRNSSGLVDEQTAA